MLIITLSLSCISVLAEDTNTSKPIYNEPNQIIKENDQVLMTIGFIYEVIATSGLNLRSTSRGGIIVALPYLTQVECLDLEYNTTWMKVILYLIMENVSRILIGFGEERLII